MYMKKFLLPALVAVAFHTASFAQMVYPDLVPLTEQQQARLAAVEEVKAPLIRGHLTLPVTVDNSALPYFRPLFVQSGLECGQASSIGLGLTYELDAKRNLPANVSQNQYATYFTYDYLNQGANAGVSFLESWEIVKRVGNPTVYDYGGLSAGGPTRWMTGYNLYYNAMHNRITDVGVIYINSPEGINNLKSWIYNHMGSSTPGGVAHFYSQFGAVNDQLPAGTPLAGQYVVTAWGPSPNHAMTILGYNDSICFDYNGDGQYTNNLDINGDGILDVRDWEIGGFKVANTYGNVSNWANQGFAWATYKSFAENPSSGGIWNNAAYIAYAKQNLEPRLTMKVTLKHTSRNKLKVVAGVAGNISATEPEVTLNLPILDYQGGDLYMQGGSTEADKTIELGLDATPLLSEITSGQPARFFLMVQENDPSNQATGQIVSFDLIDYNSGSTLIPGGFSNVPLVENGTTTLSIPATISFNNPGITTASLPEAKIYEPYTKQLNVSGGTSPYKWRMAIDYSETGSASVMPNGNAQALSVNNSSSGYATLQLPFPFPYYGKSYTTIYPHVDGYMMFEDHPVPWPYIIFEKTFFRNTRCISPYMGKPLVMMSSEGDGIWYQGSPDSAMIRWRLSVYGNTSGTELNFAVTLFPDGQIRFYYGTMNSSSSMRWISGLSNGDGLNYHFTSITDTLAQPANNSSFLFTTQPYPTEMSLSSDGVFSGTPQKSYTNLPLKFYVEDNNFLFSTRTLNFNTKGVEINYLVDAGGDSLIEYGETVHLTPVLKNVSNTTLHNVVMHLAVNDPFISLSDSLEPIGTLNPGQSVSFPDAFTFGVSNFIPDGHLLSVAGQLTATEDNFNRTVQMPASSAVPVVASVSVSDGNNNILMPGESGNLLVTLQNKGGSVATNLITTLAVIDPYITIQQGTALADTLGANESQVFSFPIMVSSSCPEGHIALAGLSLEGDKDVTLDDTVFFNIGPIVEDFETGTYTKYPWHFSGNSNWTLSLLQPYEGTYCSQSGSIIDSQESSMYLTLDILAPADISFYRKVSSESNYDYLYFYIDGNEMAKWAGDVPWGLASFPVDAGTHTFTWKYKKDYSVSTGADKAWVDYISWPPMSNLLLIANAGADDIACSGQGHQLSGQVMNATNLFWSTNGDGTFQNTGTVNAIYFPGAEDLNSGMVTLTLHASNGTLPSVTDSMILSIFPGPVSNAGPDQTICYGSTLALTQATAANHTSVLWSTPGDGTFDDPTILNPVYTPGTSDLLNGVVMLMLTVTGNTECLPVVDAMNLYINQEILTNAGSDMTIQYNTATQLSGSASGGSGSFSASWEPAALLTNPTVFNPVTLPLLSNQTFTLTATNLLTGCSSSDQVTITVTGGPLNVTATSAPSSICAGEQSQLSATGTGGSGSYTWSWTSNPPGFTSTLQNPVVTPGETTIYSVEMNDGFASVFASATVNVMNVPAPSIPQGPNAVNVAITTSTTYITEPGASQYSWSFGPAEAGTAVPDGPSCIVFWDPAFNGIATLNVTATNSCGTGAPSDTLFIIANTEVGQAENPEVNDMQIYPNPGKGLFNIYLGDTGEYCFKVTDLQGRLAATLTTMVGESGKLQLNLAGLPSGSYLLKAIGRKQTHTAKLNIVR